MEVIICALTQLNLLPMLFGKYKMPNMDIGYHP
jgi:hypothetical protein